MKEIRYIHLLENGHVVFARYDPRMSPLAFNERRCTPTSYGRVNSLLDGKTPSLVEVSRTGTWVMYRFEK